MIKQFYFKQFNSTSLVSTQLKCQTVIFNPIDRILSGATILSQCGPGSVGNEEVLCIPQSSYHQSLISYPGHSSVGVLLICRDVPSDCLLKFSFFLLKLPDCHSLIISKQYKTKIRNKHLVIVKLASLGNLFNTTAALSIRQWKPLAVDVQIQPYSYSLFFLIDNHLYLHTLVVLGEIFWIF